MSNERDINTSLAIFESMQDNEPFKTYEKTSLGKVHLTILDPFNGEPSEILLTGNPANSKDRETCRINVWSSKEDQFLRRVNRTHFDKGSLRELPTKKKQQEANEAKEINYNQLSDEQIEENLNKPFLALKAMLNKFTATAPVERTLRMAEDMEKSEKILEAIRARLSELELEGIPQPPVEDAE